MKICDRCGSDQEVKEYRIIGTAFMGCEAKPELCPTCRNELRDTIGQFIKPLDLRPSKDAQGPGV